MTDVTVSAVGLKLMGRSSPSATVMVRAKAAPVSVRVGAEPVFATTTATSPEVPKVV